VPGELTEANNQRGFTVEIAAERLQVLYYAERLGLGYKYLRAELGRDPGIQFTALLRIQGDRYQLTGDEDPNTQPLRDGFPTDPALLEPFQVIVLAAAPDSAWSAEAQQALAQRVRRGAALVWFDSGEALQGNAYRESALDALRPWQVGPSATARRGDYRLAVPAAAATHPLLDGVGETLRDAAIASLVTGLQPRPDATVLAEASAEDRSHPILAWRAVDEGQVLGVASDTLWRLARGSPEQRSAYGTLWRQAVRSLAGRDERLGQLRLRWDRERYRPGDEALLTVQVLEADPGMQRSLTASLRPPGSDELQSLAVKPAPIGDGYLVRVPLALSGEHALELELAMGDGRRERHTAVVDVASRLAEGARLEVDHQALDRLALAGEGRYVREDDTVAWRALVESLAAGETVRSDHPLISGRWWPLLVICALLLGEWLLRRRLGLP